MLLLLTQGALAVPVFQVYIDGATADSLGPDEFTWFTTSNSFDLIVSGAYGPWTKSLTEVTLLISVPQGETGTISITGGDGISLLTERTAADDGFFNPDVEAVLDLLENETGNTAGGDGYPDKSFLPEDVEFNNHYPFKEEISDFLVYDLGDFDEIPDAVSNYSTDAPIAYNVADGEQKVYSVLVDGFSTVHFDAYGYVQIAKYLPFKAKWSINPGSHDATYMVPEPATVFLLGIGSSVLLKAGRRSRKRRRS